MSIERMSWFSSSLVMSDLPPGSTKVSSSNTSLRPLARSRAVGKLQRVRRFESTRRIRSFPRSAISIPPGSGPFAVTTRFGFCLGLGFGLGFGGCAWCVPPQPASTAAPKTKGMLRRQRRTIVGFPCMDVHARRERLAHSRLYLVLEARPHGGDPRPLLDAALRGGVDVVQ